MTKQGAPRGRRSKTGVRPRRADGVSRTDRPLPGTSQKNAILDIALEEFARDGFHGAVLSEIAQRCGIAHPLINYHFGGKESLWRAAIAYAFDEMARSVETIKDATRDLTPLAALKFVSRSLVRYAAAYPTHAAIIQDEMRRQSERFTWLVDNYLKPVHRLYDELIRQAVESGEVKPIEASYLTSLMIGPVVMFFGNQPLIQRLYPEVRAKADLPESFADAYVEVIFGGLENSKQRVPRGRRG